MSPHTHIPPYNTHTYADITRFFRVLGFIYLKLLGIRFFKFRAGSYLPPRPHPPFCIPSTSIRRGRRHLGMVRVLGYELAAASTGFMSLCVPPPRFSFGETLQIPNIFAESVAAQQQPRSRQRCSWRLVVRPAGRLAPGTAAQPGAAC